jgi:hypothetical protein
MSGGFDEREKGYENKWAHDEDLRFRAVARRNKLLGQWAAETLGLTGAAADSYASVLLDMEVKGAKDEDYVRKIHADFAARNVAFSEHFVGRKMDELANLATQQIMSEPKA